MITCPHNKEHNRFRVVIKTEKYIDRKGKELESVHKSKHIFCCACDNKVFPIIIVTQSRTPKERD